jgi:hypothetical protein
MSYPKLTLRAMPLVLHTARVCRGGRMYSLARSGFELVLA